MSPARPPAPRPRPRSHPRGPAQPPRSGRRPGRPCRGFTLLEILLALSVFAGLMVALNLFIFSMGELWGRGSRERLERQHARAVAFFLEDTLRQAVVVAPGRGEGGVSWQPLPGAFQRDKYLSWESGSAPDLVPWPGDPLPFVTLRLRFRAGEGLTLLTSSALEKVESAGQPPPPRETLLSAFVTGLQYDYYDKDFERWETVPSPRTGPDNEPLVPQRLRLAFTFSDGTGLEVPVILPATPEDGQWIF